MIKKGLSDQTAGQYLNLQRVMRPTFFERIHSMPLLYQDSYLRYELQRMPGRLIQDITYSWEAHDLHCRVSTKFSSDNYSFAFYVMTAENRILEKRGYSSETECTFPDISPSACRLRCYVRYAGTTESIDSFIPVERSPDTNNEN